MATFTVYADRKVLTAVTDELLGAVARRLRAVDPGRNVGVDDRKPGILQLSFNVTAEGHHDAVVMARRLLTEAIPASELPGEITEIATMDEAGQQVVWVSR